MIESLVEHFIFDAIKFILLLTPVIVSRIFQGQLPASISATNDHHRRVFEFCCCLIACTFTYQSRNYDENGYYLIPAFIFAILSIFTEYKGKWRIPHNLIVAFAIIFQARFYDKLDLYVLAGIIVGGITTYLTTTKQKILWAELFVISGITLYQFLNILLNLNLE